MAETFTEADKNPSNPSSGGRENARSQGVYASVKERVGSFLGRRWFGWRADDPSGPEGEGPLKREWNEGYGGGVGNIVRGVALAVSFIAGTATWAVAAETSLPVSRMTSKALHAGGYEDPTVYDQYMSVQGQNSQLISEKSSLKELAEREKQEVERRKVEEKKLLKEKNQLQTTNKTLTEKNKALTAKVVKFRASQKPKSKLGYKAKSKISRTLVHAKKMKSWKERAIENQKVISAKLEELLRWQGKAGKLANYGVREWVFDSEAKTKTYVLKEQPKSLSIIKQKIAALQKMGLAAKKTPTKTHQIKGLVKAPSKSSRIKDCPPRKGIVKKTTAPKTSPKVRATKPVSDGTKSDLIPKTQGVPTKTVPLASSITGHVQQIVPKMETPASQALSDHELDQLHGAKGVSPTDTVSVITPDGYAFNAPMQAPITEVHENPKPEPEPLGIAELLSLEKQHKPLSSPTSKSPTTVKKVWKPSIASHIEKGSGLTPSNITEEKLVAFLDKANRKLRSVGTTDPRMKDAAFTMERVVKNGFPGWRVFLKYKGWENNFIVSKEKASWNYKNFQIVASPERMSNWAVRKVAEREKRLEKKKVAKREVGKK